MSPPVHLLGQPLRRPQLRAFLRGASTRRWLQARAPVRTPAVP